MAVLKDYEDIIGKRNIRQIEMLAKLSRNKKVVMVNSTRDGGGVAEILHRLVPLINELGINCRWEVISADKDFFSITKKIHNALQGEKIRFSGEELEIYRKVNEDNARNLNLDADIVVIHDPQPLPLIDFYKARRAKWVWRCHIDMSGPDLRLWKFLKNYLEEYDASIFSIEKFSKSLSHPQYLIAPSIDPLSDKNKVLDKDEIKAVSKMYNIKKDKPVILQVSRFDRFKDPIGVIKAFRLVRKEINCQLILAGGTASDDPEGEAVLEEVRKEAEGDPDIHILLLKPKSDIEINALQRIADVVLQKSLKEGFGLTVTEAMWKGKPVIGGEVGGITTQLHNHRTGFLVNSIEGAAYRIRYLLNRPLISKRIGEQAKKFVSENFLITRHLRDYLSLFYILENPGKNIIYTGENEINGGS
ncbi:MAG: glycosyltransferase [Actinomycetota bacterium]|nr:glycosyltransferase [Actinomycetota bacterium]